MDCIVFTFENGVPRMHKDSLLFRHILCLLMNSFNKTEAAIFHIQTMFHEDFPLFSD